MVCLVGYRFHPTHEQIHNFLKKKTADPDFSVQTIKELPIYRFDPWELPDESAIQSKDQEWYFFCLLSKYKKNSKRTNRQTKSGFWKITGQDRNIKSKRTGKVIYIKKTLVFHQRLPGSKKAIRTNWIMDENHLKDDASSRENLYVLCRIKRKLDDKSASTPEENPSQLMASTSGNNIAENSITGVRGETFLVEPSLRAHSELFNEVNMMNCNSYTTEQSLIHLDQKFSNDVHTNMSSPNEAQSSLPRLDPDIEEWLVKMDSHFNSQLLEEFEELPPLNPLTPVVQESSNDNNSSIYYGHQPNQSMIYDFGNHVDENMELEEGSQLHNTVDYNYLCGTEESLNLETFNDDQTMEDEYTGLLDSVKNECFFQEPTVTLPSDIKSLSIEHRE